jgi:alpha-beta hydrolase superfamily lysophospholipase
MDVAIDAVDRAEPIRMHAAIAETVAGLPIVEYLHASAVTWQRVPTVLAFSGGGVSGAMLAMLAEHLAAHRIRLVSFDMPGHTPVGLLGPDTPPRTLVSRANNAVRHGVSVAMIRRWIPRSSRLEVLSHSAGIADVARLIGDYGAGVDRFVICGCAIPSIGAMRHAARVAAAADSMPRIRLGNLIRTRQLHAGNANLIYGPPANRTISDCSLARYECSEHFGVALSMLRTRIVLGQDWRARSVLLVGSAGDAIASPDRIMNAERRLRALGAVVRSEILSMQLPHAFLSFQAAAEPVADLIAGDDPLAFSR